MHTNKNSQQLPIAAPDIIRAFQKDYPNIDYELLLGDYTELEEWVKSGRVDCAFLRLPTCAGGIPGSETVFGISVGPVSSGEGQPGEEEEVQQQDKEAEKRRAWFAVFHRCEMLSLGEQAEEGVTDQRPQGVAE